MNTFGLTLTAFVLIITLSALGANMLIARRKHFAALQERARGVHNPEAFARVEKWKRMRKVIIWACIIVCSTILWLSR